MNNYKAYTLNLTDEQLELIRQVAQHKNDSLVFELARAEAIADSFTVFYVNLYHEYSPLSAGHIRKCVDTYATTSLEYACDLANTLIDVYDGKPVDINETMHKIKIDDEKHYKEWCIFGKDVWTGWIDINTLATIAIEATPGFSDNKHLIDE